MEDLKPWERELVAGTVVRDGKVELDATGRRIDNLIHGPLKQVAVQSDNWNVLYRDPVDGRYWELDYPHSERHGGGPMRLTAVSEEEVRARYDI